MCTGVPGDNSDLCRTVWGHIRCVQECLGTPQMCTDVYRTAWGQLGDRYQQEDVGVGKRILLKRIFKKIGWEGFDSECCKWQAVVYMVINIRIV